MAAKSKARGGLARLDPALSREIASIRADPAIVAYGNYVLQPQDPVLVARGMGRGVDLYWELLADPHVYGVLGKRMRAVVGREWIVEEASTRPADVQAAELVRTALDRMSYDAACMAGLTAIIAGYSVQEVLWERATVDGSTRILPSAVRFKRPTRFRFTADRELRLITREQMTDGVPVPDRKFLVIRHNEHLTEDPHGLGIGHVLWWYAFFKRKGLAYWLVFSEKFGSPTAKGTYPGGAAASEIQKLLSVLRAISQETAIAVPEGMEIELIEASRTGGADGYQKLLDYFDRMASIAILGETLTTHIGSSGSKAAASVHDEVREDICDADCDLLSAAHNASLIRWIVELNLPGAEPPSVWRRKPVEQDLEQQTRIDKALLDMGWEPTDEHIQEVYGTGYKRAPKPESRADPSNPTAPPARQPARPVELAEAAPPDAIDRLTDQAMTIAQPHAEALIDSARGVLERATTFEEAQAMLLELTRTLPVDLGRAIAEARLVAELNGRSDLQDGPTPEELA
ncbi:DUF935 family protein [Thalassobaculum sp.]|uniref:DUF935 domain-containing protein n=1 Tax=Thalassobaculum sp. TaxID=2022740 RepID=UPI0032EC5FF1